MRRWLRNQKQAVSDGKKTTDTEMIENEDLSHVARRWQRGWRAKKKESYQITMTLWPPFCLSSRLYEKSCSQ